MDFLSGMIVYPCALFIVSNLSQKKNNYLRINIVENYFSTLLKKHEIETNENIFIQWPRLFKSHKYFMRVQLLDLIRCRGFVRG